MQLYVPFSDIPEKGREYEIKDSSWFPEELGEPAGLLSVHVRLTKKSDFKIELKGNLRAGVVLQCDRCLAQYVFHVDAPMQLMIEAAGEVEHWRLKDMETAEAELETISQDRQVVDLAELLRQQLYLALPAKNLCSETCAGLCPQCGTNLNEGTCSCTEKIGSSPFAVLQKLKKK